MTFSKLLKAATLGLSMTLISINPAMAAGNVDSYAAGGNFSNSAEGDIVKAVTEAGIFDTLATALSAANLLGTLQGQGPFTVFAPTDKAFGTLPKIVIDNLLKPENQDQLSNILSFHVVPGRLTEADIRNKQLTVSTVAGSQLTISGLTKVIHVNGNSHVAVADIETTNGVIHVIDKVMVPK